MFTLAIFFMAVFYNNISVVIKRYNMTLNISSITNPSCRFTGAAAVQPAPNSQSLPADTVELSKKNVKKAGGTFADKKFTIEASEGLTRRDIAGEIDGVEFDIRHQGKFLKADTITGFVGDKELNLKSKANLTGSVVEGTIGGKPVNLKISDTWTGKRIKGTFKDKNIDIKLNSKFIGYGLKGDNIDLRIKNKNIFGNDVNVKGVFNEDPDLIPLLMDTVYCLQAEELMMALVLM